MDWFIYLNYLINIVTVGDIVDVWIIDIDEQKGKVSLTMVNPNE